MISPYEPSGSHAQQHERYPVETRLPYFIAGIDVKNATARLLGLLVQDPPSAFIWTTGIGAWLDDFSLVEIVGLGAG
jgi:hypothetical protein